RFGGMKTYNWEGVNPDGYFLDKLEPIPSALPSFQKLFQVSATALSIPRKISTTPEADRKRGSAGMPRPPSHAVFCLKKKLAAASLPAGPPSRPRRAGGHLPLRPSTRVA